MKRYLHQTKVVEANPEKVILAWGTGLGKSLALEDLAKKNEVLPLVICPKSIKERWAKVFPTISKEGFRKDWEQLPYYPALIVDEIHHFSGQSQMSKALGQYTKKHNPLFIWGATATPYRSTPLNVYILARHMGLHWPYRQFRTTFFEIKYFGKRMVWVAKTDAASRTALIDLLKTFCDVVSADDAGLPPDDVHQEELFYLTDEQNKAIAKLKLTETNPVVRYGKEHQIAQGQVKGDEFTVHTHFKNEKIPRILEMAQQHPSMLIFAKYTIQIQLIKDALVKAGHTVYTLTGATKDRQAVIDEVAKGDSILIANTSLGEGWEAPHFDFIVFASLPWSYVDFLQCCGRASRANVPKRRTYVTMTVKDSIDERVKEALEKKQDFSLELYANKTKD